MFVFYSMILICDYYMHYEVAWYVSMYTHTHTHACVFLTFFCYTWVISLVMAMLSGSLFFIIMPNHLKLEVGVKTTTQKRISWKNRVQQQL